MTLTFKSFSGVAVAADQLIRSYAAFAGDGGVLEQTTDTRNGPKFIVELRALRSHVAIYAERARAIMADSSFAQLDEAVRDDVAAIAAEAEVALVEIDDEADPDKKWTGLTAHQRENVTQHLPINGTAVDAVRARLRHQRKGVPPLTKPAK